MSSETAHDRNPERHSITSLEGVIAAAAAHFQAGRLEAAEEAYRAVLVLAPNDPAIEHNLGVIAAAQGKHQNAITLFESVIQRQPRYVAAHYNRAAALLAMGQSKAAIEGFSRTCMLAPEHYGAHRALAFLWLSEGQRDRALDHFARTYELRRGEDRSELAAKSLTYSTRGKLQHDAEQFQFLSERARDGQVFKSLARTYGEIAREVPHDLKELSDQHRDRLGDNYNGPIHIREAPAIGGHAVSRRTDVGDLTRSFGEGRSGAVYFDDLLTPDALHRLRRFLLEGTIWHDFSHIGGFVASYLEDGLACPLVLQIAEEIRATFPALLKAHPLSQAWAFKGLETASAVDLHADDAAVSVNFWITPAEANLNPDRGGLVVYTAPPPRDWQMSGYASDQGPIVAFLEQNAHAALQVPYRENRAVMFESRLFHRSDAPSFAPSYENHRINLTFLFGRHGENLAPTVSKPHP